MICHMKKILTATLFCLAVTDIGYAQDGAASAPKTREFDHIIGVQINELTKQILSVNNTSSTAANPYLFTYNLTERSSGLGFRLGFGCNFISKSLDGGGKLKSQSVDIRVGFEKAFKLSDKWSAGAGIDLVLKNIDTSIDQNSVYGYNTGFKSQKLGAGPMGWLRYSLSKRILIGTEISMYYLSGTEKTTGSYYGNDTDNKVAEFRFNLPVAFFLSLKL